MTTSRCPTRKKGWRSRKRAMSAAMSWKDTGTPGAFYAYKCPQCGLWHLTSRAPRETTGSA